MTVNVRILGLNISYYRKLKGFTQAQLAERAYISVRYLSKIECGHVTNCASLQVLCSIANVLNVTIDDLLQHDIS